MFPYPSNTFSDHLHFQQYSVISFQLTRGMVETRKQLLFLQYFIFLDNTALLCHIRENAFFHSFRHFTRTMLQFLPIRNFVINKMTLTCTDQTCLFPFHFILMCLNFFIAVFIDVKETLLLSFTVGRVYWFI